MLEVQKYLQHKNLNDLNSEFFVEASIDENIVSLNYNMIHSPMHEEICKECRGLILELNTWKLLAYPFYKFFNLGEPQCANINWNSAYSYEKLDGTMIILWFNSNDDSWQFGTRSVPRGKNIINGISMSFSKLAKVGLQNVLNDNNLHKFYSKLNKNYTYIFELTSPYNRIVCNYKEIKMTLIGIRNLISLKEIPIELVNKELNLPIPKKFQFENINDMISIVNNWDPLNHEGIVVTDRNFNRAKIKSVNYCLAHKSISSLSASDKNLLKIIISQKDDDFIPILSDLVINKLNNLKLNYKNLINKISQEWEELKNIENIKEFALQAQEKTWPAILFSLKHKKIDSIDSFMNNCIDKPSSLDNILKLIQKEKT